MRRNVILPQELELQLNALPNMREETKGVLLYSQQGLDCNVDLIFLTGIGPKDNITVNDKLEKIINTFFKKNSNYKSIILQTRTKSTLAQYEPRYRSNFTPTELEGYKKQAAQNKDFLGMIVTPFTALLYGADGPELMNVPASEEFRARQYGIGTQIQMIASKLGLPPVPIKYSPRMDTMR